MSTEEKPMSPGSSKAECMSIASQDKEEPKEVKHTRKYVDFVNNNIGNKKVSDVPGIGEKVPAP